MKMKPHALGHTRATRVRRSHKVGIHLFNAHCRAINTNSHTRGDILFITFSSLLLVVLGLAIISCLEPARHLARNRILRTNRNNTKVWIGFTLHFRVAATTRIVFNIQFGTLCSLSRSLLSPLVAGWFFLFFLTGQRFQLRGFLAWHNAPIRRINAPFSESNAIFFLVM